MHNSSSKAKSKENCDENWVPWWHSTWWSCHEGIDDPNHIKPYNLPHLTNSLSAARKTHKLHKMWSTTMVKCCWNADPTKALNPDNWQNIAIKEEMSFWLHKTFELVASHICKTWNTDLKWFPCKPCNLQWDHFIPDSFINKYPCLTEYNVLCNSRHKLILLNINHFV